jgi:beta-galactosidase
MFYHGACYYPEHWTPEQARQHIPLMQKAGFNVVRMAEFAWNKFQPDQGRFKFDWLDPVIEALKNAGIKTVLGTPTAIPPQWAIVRYPDILQKDRQGHVRNPGSRCHCCKNASAYQILCEAIVREMARHYAGCDDVIGWQVDNEFGCHYTTRCYCEFCEKAFRDWLLAKYKTTDALNEAWGAAFWGFEFRNWAEVPLPKAMPAAPNPGHWLDFVRFSSDTQVKFMKMQYDILKSLCPGHFVTHNYMGTFPEVDYYKVSQHLDFPVWDNYPDPYGHPLASAYSHDITRSFKGKFWVMEHKSGPTGDAAAGVLDEQPEPGDIRRWAWQSVANGADGVVYFRWRACLTGAEQYWHGILDHDGVPRRRYHEVRKIGEELARAAAELEGTSIETPVALIRNFDTLWSLERQPTIRGFSYDAHCFDLYTAAKATGHSCDIVNTDADLSKYATVLAPCLALVDAALLARLDAYVKAGGTLVLTPMAGTRTPANAMSDQTRPGLLAPMAGLTIEEVRPYQHGQTHELVFKTGPMAGKTATVGTWVEVLEPGGGVEIVAEYAGGEPVAGRAAIACNRLGKGRVFYLGVYLPAPALREFLGDILPEFPVKHIPDGVEVTVRRGAQRRLLFLINHSVDRKDVMLPGQFTDVLSGESIGPKVALAKNGVLVLRV